MNEYPALVSMHVSTPDEAKNFIRFLVSSGLDFHLDDKVDDIIWNCEPKPSVADIKELKRLQTELWSVCNPWELMEADKPLEDLYLGLPTHDRFCDCSTCQQRDTGQAE